MTAAAVATETLRVGCLVLANDYRHPVVLAKELATIDHLSDGRVEVGLGAGWMAPDYEQAGMPFDPPGVRVSRLEEAVDDHQGALRRWSRHRRTATTTASPVTSCTRRRCRTRGRRS